MNRVLSRIANIHRTGRYAVLALSLVAAPVAAEPAGDAPGTPPSFDDPRPLPEAADAAEADEARRALEEQARTEEERRAEEAERRQRETEAALEQVQQEAARQAEESRRAAEADRTGKPADTGATGGTGEAVRAPACDAPSIAATPLPFRRMEIGIKAACAGGETARVGYGPYAFTARLDSEGQARILIDAFLPDVGSVELTVPGAPPRALPLEFDDDRPVTKVAVVWEAPVNLDLHALEYAARRGGPGHVWENAPSAPEAALRRTDETGRGRGFLTMLDRPVAGGTRAEVYTFVHPAARQTGTVTLALDFESRASAGPDAFCADAPHATIPFTVHVSGPGAAPLTENALLPAIPCGQKPEGDARYIGSAIPDLRPR